MAIMQPFAEKIFLGLVFIEIIITCVHFLADQDEPTRLLAELVKKSLALGFLYAMIVNAPIWFSAIIQGFQQIGGQAAGIPALSPSSAFDSGLALFQIIYRGFASLGWFHVTLAAFIALIAGLIMFLSFALIARWNHQYQRKTDLWQHALDFCSQPAHRGSANCQAVLSQTEKSSAKLWMGRGTDVPFGLQPQATGSPSH